MPAALDIRSARTLVLCKSVHHGNTARLAERIASVLGADVSPPEFGGVNHRHPDERDLARAEASAQGLKNRCVARR